MATTRSGEPGSTVVVGAGPAGSAAAIVLARAGRPVVLVDRATFPRDKCCGDGLTTLALRELERLGLDPATVPSWQPVDHAVVRSPSGREVTFPLPTDEGSFAAVATRSDLDAALVDAARDAGAELVLGTAFADLGVADGPEARRRVVLADGRHLDADVVVAADGMWSPVRKALGIDLGGYLGDWHAFRQYFTGVTGRAAEELIVWFEADLLPGYAWSFPLPGGRANVGFGIHRGGRYRTRDMKQLWPELLARPHIARALGADAVPEAPHKAWPIPARVGELPLVAPGVCFVGDAAAATDPMTGEGIGQALLTGRRAAEAVLAGGTAADITARYEAQVRRDLVADHRLAHALSGLLARRLTARGAVRVAGATGWTRRQFGRWLFEDYPRALVFTPRRWRRGVMGRPGADLGGSDPSMGPGAHVDDSTASPAA